MYLVNGSRSVLVHNMLLWVVNLCIWYSNNMIAPCYPESVANEVLSTVGDVRFIKWAQDLLVSFVKCEPPSILPCGGDKPYNAFKDVLAPIGFFMLSTWNGTSMRGLCWRTQQASLWKGVWPWRERAFFTTKDKWVGDRLHPSWEVFAYLVLRGKVSLNPQFANLSSSSMGAIGSGVNSIENVL